jgi:GAF domain-containing protein
MLSSLAATMVAGIATPLASELIDVLRKATQVWSTRLGNIQLLESDSTLKLAVHQGFRRAFVDQFRVVKLDDGVPCGRALRNGRRVVVQDVEADQEFTPYRSIAAAAGYRAVQSTPIVGRERRILGVMSTHSSIPRQLAANEARDFDHLAVRAAEVIEQVA